ncbi:MAG: ribbon-helix-helix domain-containing protein [Acidimicrobiales bacterium]|jgi:hypothetical protein
MAQLVTRVDEALILEVDELVARGAASSRSDLVRMGLERIIDEYRRQKAGEQIAEAYRQSPETVAELSGLGTATRALIEEEPW